MNGYDNKGRCHECDGTHGTHYYGFCYDGEGGKTGFGGSAIAQY